MHKRNFPNFILARNISIKYSVTIRFLSKEETLLPSEERRIDLGDYDGGVLRISIFSRGKNLILAVWMGFVPTRNTQPIVIDPELSCITHDNLSLVSSSETRSECKIKEKESGHLIGIGLFLVIIFLLIFLFFYLKSRI